MAKRAKTGGRDFQPGISGNPLGRPPLPQEVRDFKNAAKVDIINEFKYLWSLTEDQLNEIAGIKITIGDDGKEKEEKFETDTPAIRKAIARSLLKAIKQGSMFDLDRILDRVIGKVKEEDGDSGAKGNIHLMVLDVIETIEQKNKEQINGEKVNEKKDNEN